MKSLLVLVITNMIFQFASAGELDSIELIRPISYDKASTRTQTIESKIIIFLGDLVHFDVQNKVKKTVAPFNKDLSSYFGGTEELDKFVDQVVSNGRSSLIGTSFNDQNLIKFYGYLGKNLIGGFADKILDKEGIKDADRRSLWVNKILFPFNSCIEKAKNSLFDAGHCMEALYTSLVPSAGVGIVYELSRKSLGPSLPDSQKNKFYLEQVKAYKDCMQTKAGLPSDVKPCALDSMKSGVEKVTNMKLSKIITDSTSSLVIAEDIKKSVWPSFTNCTAAVGNDPQIKTELNAQFINCIDDLVAETAPLIARDKLINLKPLQSNFTQKESNEIINENLLKFKACIENQKKSNNRKDGMINTSKCEEDLTNTLTLKIVNKNFSKSAEESLKNNPQAIASALKDVQRSINNCWQDGMDEKKRESCIRSSTIVLSQSIASLKLDSAIPSTIQNKSEVIKNSLKDFGSCLEKNIPTKVSTAPNLTTQIGICSNSLTTKTAITVAKETLILKAKDSKQSDTETKSLVDKLVLQNFSHCLGTKASDEVIEKCTADLTKDATKAIVLSYGKKQVQDQLNTSVQPEKISQVENNFSTCIDKLKSPAEIKNQLDECTKNFSIDFAKSLGELKLNSLMLSILGTEDFRKQKENIRVILGKYDHCLDQLSSLSMNDGVLEKLKTCTDNLQTDGVKFVSNTVNNWMSTAEKDAASILVKNEFANFLPCLGSLLPSSPYSPVLDKEVVSILKPVSVLIAQYIDYSPGDARKNLDEIIKKLSTDLKDVAVNPESRQALIDMLYTNGALDQFLKSMVRGEVKSALEKIPSSELPDDLKSTLVQKDNFDTIFSSPEGLAIKKLVMDRILKPVLMEQASLSSPPMVSAVDNVKDKVIKLLVYSPHFGDQIIKRSVQSKMDEMRGMTRFFAKVLYGSNSLNWDKVRSTSTGSDAESYIRENVLLPKFKGETLTNDQEKKIMIEAEKLVKDAVKKYEQ